MSIPIRPVEQMSMLNDARDWLWVLLLVPTSLILISQTEFVSICFARFVMSPPQSGTWTRQTLQLSLLTRLLSIWNLQVSLQVDNKGKANRVQAYYIPRGFWEV